MLPARLRKLILFIVCNAVSHQCFIICLYSTSAHTEQERGGIDDEGMQTFSKYVTHRYASLPKCNSLYIGFA